MLKVLPYIATSRYNSENVCWQSHALVISNIFIKWNVTQNGGGEELSLNGCYHKHKKWMEEKGEKNPLSIIPFLQCISKKKIIPGVTN